MNKTELLSYLHQCLAETSRRLSGDVIAELAQALATRLLATRGLHATLTASDRVALDRQWGLPGLADAVASAIKGQRASPPDVHDFVARSFAVSRLTGRAPTGQDAEQAARVRLLAEASLAFQSARDLGVTDLGLDKYVADIAAGMGLPEGCEAGEPLKNWLERTLRQLADYNPYAGEAAGQTSEWDTILDEQPTLLADWIQQRRPPKGSTEFDHEYLLRQAEILEQMLESWPYETVAVQETDSVLAPTATAAARQAPRPEPDPSSVEPSAPITVSAAKFADKMVQDGAWDPDTAGQARSTYAMLAKFLEEEHGVVSSSQFRQWHLERFDEFLREVYKHYGQSSRLRSASIAELREFSRHKPANKRGLDVSTRERHMGHIAQLLAYVSNTEDIDPKLNPSAYKGKKKGRARDDRPIPPAAQFSNFFEAPVFTGCRNFEDLDEPGSNVYHRAACFGPMLAHYQGMRREEFCGLAIEDIVVDNGEVAYIHVCFNSIRRLKNVQSIRNLALHPELVRLGFLDYVRRIGELGYDRIFPDPHNPATNAPLGNRLYNELEPLRTRLGISPHQFRHFFNNELKQKRVSQEFRADMLGHGGDSETTERYCDPVQIELQLEDLARIELRTAHLQPRPLRLLPWVEAKRSPPWARPDRMKGRKTQAVEAPEA